MTRMFLDDPDDEFDDAAEEETEEPERLDDFDENFDEDFEPPDDVWYAETLEIKTTARAADGPDFADGEEEDEEEE